MKLNRSAGWLLLTLTPLLMSVRPQQTIAGNTATRQIAAHTTPASMIVHQRWLTNPVWVLLQQAREKNKSTPTGGLQARGCRYGTGNITLPMSHIVKE